MARSEKTLWTLSYFMSVVSITCACVSMTFFIPLFAFYLPEIDEPVVKVGVVISTFAVTAILSRPVFAYFIDERKGRGVLFFGYCCIILGIMGYRLTNSVTSLLPVRILHGLGYAAVTNSAITVFTRNLDESIRKKGLTYFGLAMVFANSLGPSVGLMFRNLVGTRNAFSFALLIALIGFAGLCIAHPEKEEGLSERSSFNYFWGYELSAIPLSLFMVIAAIANSSIVTYLGKYTSEMGYVFLGTAFFLIYAIAMIAARKFLDVIQMRLGDFNVLYLANIIMAVAYLLIALSRTPAGFYAAAVIYGIGYGAVQPTLNALILTVCPKERRGAANSTFQTSLDLGAAIGAIIWGQITEIISYSQMYRLIIITAAAAVIGIKLYTSGRKGRA